MDNFSEKAFNICGKNQRITDDEEIESLNSLIRGVYAKHDIKKGDIIKRDQIFFSMPFVSDQLESGLWKEGMIAKESVKTNEPVLLKNIKMPANPDYLVIKKAIHEVKAMLSEAKIILNSEFEVEYSHHYGIENFRETGVVIINVINREYCKKILVQLPNQKHPSHHHKRKEETFQILSGTLNVLIDGREKKLVAGDTCLVLPGIWHSFYTNTGCIFEEISTTHFNNDSVYRDKRINDMPREKRKTIVNHWGRYEIPAKSL